MYMYIGRRLGNILLKVVISFTLIMVLYNPTTSADTAAGTGLRGEYYSNMNLTGLKMTRTDAAVDFNWGVGAPAASIGTDHFSVRWSGSIKPNYSETYTFWLDSDDGVRLWVDNQLLIDSWAVLAGERTSKTISLTAGKSYDIQIEYFENDGGASVKLLWSSASQGRQVVPQSQLYVPAETTGSGLKGEYFDNMDLTGLKLTRTDAFIDFSWGEGSPDASIGPEHFSIRWTGSIKPKYSESYTFYVNSDDGVRLWVDNKLIIDSWEVLANERTSQAIQLSAGQRYDIRMETFENTGGAMERLSWSSSSQPKQVVPQSQLYPPQELSGVGLKGEYYYNMDLTDLALTRTDPTINFDWGLEAPSTILRTDTFSVRWTGSIKPKYSEEYTFYFNADDGVRLWVDGKLLMNRWMNQAGQFESSKIKLKAGQKYEIQVEYFENLGGAAVGMMWQSASQTKEFVPQNVLYPPAEVSGSGLHGKYYDNMDLSGFVMSRPDPQVNFSWQLSSPQTSIGADTFSAEWTGTIVPEFSETYTFYLNGDDGVRLWVNDKLIIDSWETLAAERTSTPLWLYAGYRYNIRIEYFENSGAATVILAWSSPRQSKQVVPQSRLYLPIQRRLADEYLYDVNGRLQSIKTTDGSTLYYSYDANGNLLKINKD